MQRVHGVEQASYKLNRREHMEKHNFPIVIVEGADCQGKSTLISQLMEKHPNNCYIHNAVVDDIKSLHENTIQAAVAASKEHWVFIDRLHLSEKVYGTIFRGGPSYDVDEFDKVVSSFVNVHKILCVVDKETSLAKHAERRSKEMFSDISRVWDMYNDVTDPSWARYSWKTDKIDLDTLEVSPK